MEWLGILCMVVLPVGIWYSAVQIRKPVFPWERPEFQGGVVPDAGALSAYKRERFKEQELEWMTAWVAALSDEDRAYVESYDLVGHGWGEERARIEVQRRLLHWERRRIESMAEGARYMLDKGVPLV